MSSSTSNGGARRVGTVIYLKPERIAEYKQIHAAVWPAVLEQIKDSNIEDCESLPLTCTAPGGPAPPP